MVARRSVPALLLAPRLVATGVAAVLPAVAAGPAAPAQARPRGAEAAPARAGTAPPARGLTTTVLTTGRDGLGPPAARQGWWSDTQPNTRDNDNHLVGHIAPDDYRAWFTFDLRDVRSHVVSARLEVFSHQMTGDPTEVLGLFDVHTDPHVLDDAEGSSAAVFADLGSGTSYGRVVVDTSREDTWLALPLDRAGVRAIDRHTGGTFSIGAALLSRSGDREVEALFLSSGTYAARLVLRTAPGPRAAR